LPDKAEIQVTVRGVSPVGITPNDEDGTEILSQTEPQDVHQGVEKIVHLLYARFLDQLNGNSRITAGQSLAPIH
jgi:hypothetical protein